MSEAYRAEAFIDVIRDADDAVDTQRVASAVGCSCTRATKRLEQLEKTGDVDGQKTANGRVWSFVEPRSGYPIEEAVTVAEYEP